MSIDASERNHTDLQLSNSAIININIVFFFVVDIIYADWWFN